MAGKGIFVFSVAHRDFSNEQIEADKMCNSKLQTLRQIFGVNIQET